MGIRCRLGRGIVPTKIYEEWEKWRIELPILRDILIPRCYTPKSETPLSVQLHGFCDASESAYAAVVYLRSELQQGQIHLALVAAKTKVAPMGATLVGNMGSPGQGCPSLV